MKKAVLIVLLVSAISASAQTSLKDALYSGKLKSDTGTVVRKGEDLSSKIDTTTRKPPAPVKMVATPVVTTDSVTGVVTIVQPDSVTSSSNSSNPAAAAPVSATKDNNKIWKEYIDSIAATVRSEVFPSKKIKTGTYSVLIEYEIGLQGEISVNSVSSSPENSYLEDQIKERITLTAPQMTPLLNNFGKPRKAIKKQTLTLTK